MVNYDNIPDELKRLNQWVSASDRSKVPMKSYEYIAASSTDPDTWSSFDVAYDSYKQGYYDYCGFVFNDNGYVGIDIDTGYDEDGFINELSADIISRCHSYTEKSRSGRGFHIVVKGDLPFTGKNNLNGIEIYKASRYFIMTGDLVLFRKIIENQSAIDYVVSKCFSETLKSGNNNVLNKNKLYVPIWNDFILKNGKLNLKPTYPPILNGTRNDCLTSLAGTLHNVGYDKSYIFKELQFVNDTCCSQPLDLNELRLITNSITRYKRKESKK